MIGMVLAAGAGRRLRPYTDTLPKALVPIDGATTILDIAIRNLAAVELREIAVVVGYRAAAVEQRRASLEEQYGVKLTLIYNDMAEEWNNAYSFWTSRQNISDGVLMVNGDTVHPVAVEETLLWARGPGVLLAVDVSKTLGDEEMKVTVNDHRELKRITKLMDPSEADGEYIGATLVEAHAVPALVDALEATWRKDPQLYYEDGYQEMVDRGEIVGTIDIPREVPWVEVDDHIDLERARAIACRY